MDTSFFQAYGIPDSYLSRLFYRYFYSYASCEAWLFPALIQIKFINFYSHASCEAWLRHYFLLTCQAKFLLTCLLRGMTDPEEAGCLPDADFYSHASCEAWRSIPRSQTPFGNFYSHASCEAWPENFTFSHPRTKFLLTCLLRGMTFISVVSASALVFLLTCLLRGMTERVIRFHVGVRISTHMPLARHDALSGRWTLGTYRFLLTCLLRGMTDLRKHFYLQ